MTKKGLMGLLFLIAISLFVKEASAYSILFKKGIKFYTADAYGVIQSNQDFYTSKCYFDNNQIVFNDLDMGSSIFEEIGFRCKPDYTIITLSQISNSNVKYSIYAPEGASLTDIYLGERGFPTTISNVYYYEYDEGSKILSLNVSHVITEDVVIELTWSYVPEEETEIDALFKDTKLLEGIILIWHNNVGSVIFPSTILFILGAVLYIRYQTFIPAVIFGIIIFALIRPTIPAEIFGFILVMMALGVAIILYWLFVRERR